MRFKIYLTAMLLAGAALTSTARADVISYSDSVPLQSTNFNSSVTLPLFDPSIGILEKVTLKLTGHVEGAAKFESLDSEPATVEMELAAQITLQRPDLSTLVVTLPLVMTSDDVGAFDGVIDFGGTSGRTYANLMASQLEIFMTMDPGDLALFTGVGNIVLPVVALGASTGSGAGNLLLQFNTSAAADVTVCYQYIPEPATAGLIAGGLIFFARRRKNRA